MKKSHLFASAAMVGALSLFGGTLMADQSKAEPAKPAPAPTPAPAKPASPAPAKPAAPAPATAKPATPAAPQGGAPGAMDPEMEAWVKASMLGEQHKMLAEGAGNWNLSVKMWEKGAAEPSVSTATAKCTLGMDGRFILETVDGNFGGMPFKGLGMRGYDNVKKKFWSSWFDSYSTAPMMAWGDYDAATKTMTLAGEYMNPLNHTMTKFRWVVKHTDDGKVIFEEHHADAGAKEMKVMEITYTRA